MNFATYKHKHVSSAFSALFSTVYKEVKRSADFIVIKTACLTCADKKLSKRIEKTKDFDSLFKLLAVNKPYCNWVNVVFLEVIAASANSKLANLIENYKTVVFSKTLREVWNCIPRHKAKTKYYSEIRAKIDDKDPDGVTVKELLDMCPQLIKDIALLIAVVETGSLRITWLIPRETVFQAYLSALMLPQESRSDSYLQIGDWVAYHPLHVLQSLLKEYCECNCYR